MPDLPNRSLEQTMEAGQSMTALDRLEKIVADGLCLGCGLCSAVAGSDALSFARDEIGEPRPFAGPALDGTVMDLVYDIWPGFNLEGLPHALADGLDGNTRILKLVPPSPRGAGIGAGIVPMASLVDIAAGGESGTRRNADRRRRVGVGGAQAAACQRNKVRGYYKIMASAAHGIKPVFVRQNDKKVTHGNACGSGLVFYLG